MFRQILVPLDGSKQAERVLAVAARIARRAEGTVTLMQIVGAEVARGSDAVPVRMGDHVEPAPGARQYSAAYLEQMRQRPELVAVSTAVVVRDGDPAEQIVSEAAGRGTDLIILSHRRHGAAASFFVGSIADAVMRRSHIPVLMLHAGSATEFRDRQTGTRRWPVQALVSLDGSPLAEAAIPYALELLSALEDGQGAKLHLTYVLDPKRAYHAGSAETEAMHEARTYLESVGERIMANPAWRSIAVTSKVEPDANAMRGIGRIAEQGANLRGDTFDFVAMATHGREGLARWLMGSVTETLVHDVHVPVLIVNPRPEASVAGGQTDTTVFEGQAPWLPLF